MLDHKTILKQFDNECYNCKVKNYSVVTVTDTMQWSVHPDFINGAINYESARDAANTLNEAEDTKDWSVVVLKVYTNQGKQDIPLCVICSGRPMPKIKQKHEKPKQTQQTLFR